MNDQTRFEGINQNIQRLLAQSTLRDKKVELRSRSDLGIEILVDGTVYQDLSEINDLALRDLIQTAMDEWQDEAALTSTNHTPLPVWRPAPFRMSRKWVIGWLIVMILVFVIPAVFITPTYMALRLSFVYVGSIIGGFTGIWGGRQIGHKVNNPGCVMSGGIFGALAGLILGGIITVFLLNLLVPV